ncbi:MAG TPA: Rrf2 family transcriptional regulator [Campylobacterales bacterium]|nr:Rrf2 family transcriptional regulator [Campylobacterales bacterium]
MILSSACQDVIRALVFLSKQKEFMQIKKITDALIIPYHFLSKNMQTVTKAGLVESKRGITGGVRLAKPAADIKILDIIRTIDGDKYFDMCILGIGLCEAENPCALHEEWAKRKDELIAMFEVISLADITKDIELSKIGRI